MKDQQKLTYTALGAAITLIGLIAVNLLTPTRAQNSSFGDKVIRTALEVMQNRTTDDFPIL